MVDKFGDEFQKKSKYYRGLLPNHQLDWKNKPNIYKRYDTIKEVLKLPNLDFNEHISFWEIINNRKSIRNFSSETISIEDLGLILHSMSGITRKGPNVDFRTTPSAGGLFPIELYPCIFNVEDIESGIYHYNVKDHSLERLEIGDFRAQLTSACLDQGFVSKASCNILLTAIIGRSQWKYLQRAYRYIYLDCGHIGQNFYLAAEALNLGACTIGAIYDDEINKLLKIDGINETAIYVCSLGKKFKAT